MAVAPPTARGVDVAIVADAHLGARIARARELSDYLASIAPTTLIVAGDLLRLDALRSGGLPDDHLAVIARLIELAHGGTRVYLLTGNHDAGLGRFGSLALGNLHIRRELELHLDGHRYFMCHGDRLEAAVRLGLPAAGRDSLGERVAAWADRRWGGLLRVLGKSPPSLSRDLRHGAARAEDHLRRYQFAAARLARERSCDTIVCAHVQRPAIATIELPGHASAVRYMNPGDWVSSLSALEYRWGKWELYRYDADDTPPRSQRLSAPLPERERRNTASLLEQIVAGGPTRR